MTGEHQTVIFAPAAALVGKGLGEPFADMVMVMVADGGNLALRQVPEQLGQRLHQVLAVGSPEGFCQIIRPGQDHVLLFFCKEQGLLVGELGLVGENGRHYTAEVCTH